MPSLPRELPVLLTPRGRLRPFDGRDAADLFAIYGDPLVMRFVGEPPFPSLATVSQMLASVERLLAGGESLEWGLELRGSGRLVGIASVAAIRGLPGHGGYCASKAAVIAYCESLRVECAASGVKVVTLLPGYVDTPLTRGNRYAMPFLMTADAFAERAYAAIVAGSSYRVIPWQMGVVAKLLRLLPNPLFDHALAGRGRKRRRAH